MSYRGTTQLANNLQHSRLLLTTERNWIGQLMFSRLFYSCQSYGYYSDIIARRVNTSNSKARYLSPTSTTSLLHKTFPPQVPLMSLISFIKNLKSPTFLSFLVSPVSSLNYLTDTHNNYCQHGVIRLNPETVLSNSVLSLIPTWGDAQTCE